jgi:hypothetical protein
VRIDAVRFVRFSVILLTLTCVKMSTKPTVRFVRFSVILLTLTCVKMSTKPTLHCAVREKKIRLEDRTLGSWLDWLSAYDFSKLDEDSQNFVCRCLNGCMQLVSLPKEHYLVTICSRARKRRNDKNILSSSHLT